MLNWWMENVFFISWGKHWKGVYVHCISRRYCHRFYIWGHDKHHKPNIKMEDRGYLEEDY